MRAQALDHLHNFRFHVVADIVDKPNALGFIAPGDAEAGFQSVGTPELTVDEAEYREGHYQWTRKEPGIGTWSPITMARGVTKSDTTFLDWCLRSTDNREYRADLTVFHWHRDGKIPGQTGNQGLAKHYRLNEAFATRCKVSGDLDATDSEISLQELDVSYEFAEVESAG